MNVYDAARKRLQHRRFQNAHEAGEDHKFNTGLSKHSDKIGLGLRLQSRLESAWRQVRIRNRKFPGDVEDRRVEYIRYHDARLGRQGAAFNALKNCPAIASFS